MSEFGRELIARQAREVGRQVAEHRERLIKLGCNRCGAPLYEIVDGEPRAMPGAIMRDEGMTTEVSDDFVLTFTDHVEYLCGKCAETV
jgi:ribosomal protein S27AE